MHNVFSRMTGYGSLCIIESATGTSARSERFEHQIGF
jgi:hypothetical protein